MPLVFRLMRRLQALLTFPDSLNRVSRHLLELEKRQRKDREVLAELRDSQLPLLLKLSKDFDKQQDFNRKTLKTLGRLNSLSAEILKTSTSLDQTLDRDIHSRRDLNRKNYKWRSLIRNQLSALLRGTYLPDELFAGPSTLNANRFQLYSQHEEDGLLVALFRHAGVVTKQFVEIGCGRSGGNSALFAREFEWTGLMLDASKTAIKKQRKLYGYQKGVRYVCTTVTPETVNHILKSNGFDGEVDLFSIDIDSYEYWILDNLEACRPRVLVVEYNALFGPTRAATVPFEPFPPNSPKAYRGASLSALNKAAIKKGYRLIFCDNEGCNAFFLRNDVARDIPSVTPVEAFRGLLSEESYRLQHSY